MKIKKIVNSNQRSFYLIVFTWILSILSTVFFFYKSFFLQNSTFYNCLAVFVPFMLLANLILFLFWSFKRKIWLLFPLITLAFGFESAKETFHFNFNKSEKRPDFTVMSYNVGTFSLDRFSHNVDRDTFMYVDTTLAYVQNLWMKNLTSDVVCFQEYYSNTEYARCENMTQRLISLGYKNFYFNKWVVRSFLGHFGVSIFSKYPIVNADSIPFTGTPSVNRGAYADILIGNDTVRIINFHLQSLSVLNNRAKYFTRFKSELDKLSKNLNTGFELHEKQIDNILYYVENSPYPVVLCGDFNNVPYSFVYQKTKKSLTNTFEQIGNGFGFTFNGFPYLIRIDNQFYKGAIEPTYFRMVDNQNSDHFPIEAGYFFVK